MRFHTVTKICLILLACIGFACSRSLLLDITPREPLAEQLATITCQVNAKIRQFHYMDLQLNGKRVLMHKYSSQETERRNGWKERNVRTHFDKGRMRLTARLAVDRSDNGRLTCNVLMSPYPSAELDLAATILVHIQQPPRIIKWELKRVSEHPVALPPNTFLEGTRVAAECSIDFGWPEANSNLEIQGEKFMDPQKHQNKHLDETFYNRSTHKAFVKVSDKENGAKFVCHVGNKNGESKKEIDVSVLYRVRELDFPYNPGDDIMVGSAITCGARGNPSPSVNITAVTLDNATHADGGPPLWTRNSSLGLGKVSKLIPKTAPPGLYGISCVTMNRVVGKPYRLASRLVRINVTALQTANMNLILGITIPLGIILLIIIICCYKSHQRKKEERREAEKEAYDYRLSSRQVIGQGGRHKRSGVETIEDLSQQPSTSKAHEQLLPHNDERDRNTGRTDAGYGNQQPQTKGRGRGGKDGGAANSSAGAGANDALVGAEASKTVWSDVSAFTALETKWPPRGTSSGSSYQREEDPEYPLNRLNPPQKPLHGIPSGSGRVQNHYQLDSRDAYSPADGASVPFTSSEVAHTIDDPHSKGIEAEEEFV